jgi:hypothetical protein
VPHRAQIGEEPSEATISYISPRDYARSARDVIPRLEQLARVIQAMPTSASWEEVRAHPATREAMELLQLAATEGWVSGLGHIDFSDATKFYEAAHSTATAWAKLIGFSSPPPTSGTPSWAAWTLTELQRGIHRMGNTEATAEGTVAELKGGRDHRGEEPLSPGQCIAMLPLRGVKEKHKYNRFESILRRLKGWLIVRRDGRGPRKVDAGQWRRVVEMLKRSSVNKWDVSDAISGLSPADFDDEKEIERQKKMIRDKTLDAKRRRN